MVKGESNIPKDGPILFLANHQNALLDALLIATNSKRKIYFVARADIFKRNYARKFLAGLYMMPIYRIRDGKASLKLNDEIFDKCSEVLNSNQCLAVFPEGNHSLKRRLRPLSKGFTRIVYSALEKNSDLDLKIVPVGLNYSSHQFYQSSVSMYFGKPIDAQKFRGPDERENIAALKGAVTDSLKELVVHIENEEHYDAIAKVLDSKRVDYLDPHKTNTVIKEIDLNEPALISTVRGKGLIEKVLTSPILLNNLLPLSVWKIIKSGIKDPVMVGTIKYGIGITVFPLFYISQSLVVGVFSNWWIGLVYFTISILTLPLLAKSNAI